MEGAIAASESYALVSAYGIYDRDVREALDGKFPRSSALSWMRSSKNRMVNIGRRKARRHKYDYWEERNHLNASITIAAVDNGTANTTKVTLSSDDHYDSGKYSYPVKNQLVVFEDETVGFVKSIDRTSDGAHEVTIYRQNANQDVQTAAVVGSKVVFYSNMQPEQSTKTESRIPLQVKISNYIQAFREHYDVTDFAEQNETEWVYKGQRFLHIKGIDDTADRFELQEELGLLITPLANGVTDADGNPVNSTNALIPQITDNGQTMEYFDSPDSGDFDDAILQLNKGYADTRYVVGYGIDLWLKLKDYVKDFMEQSPEVFFSEMGSKEMSLKFGFKSVEIGDYVFDFQRWMCLDHEDTLGAGDMPYRNMAIFLPEGNTIDPMLNETVPYCRLAFCNPGGAAHENFDDYKLWETGANAKRGATNDKLNREIHWASYKGLECRQLHKFMIWRKAS